MRNTEPETNQPIINAVNLPDQYMITGHFSDEKALFSKVRSAIAQGIRLVQFRAPWLDEKRYLELAASLSEVVNKLGGTLVVKGNGSLLQENWCQGIHLTSAQLKAGIKPVKRRPDQWIAASCHNFREIELAISIGADFVTLSPVQATSSHPEATPLGLVNAAIITQKVSLPVYWLGGMLPEHSENARLNGAQGIAAIGAYWRCVLGAALNNL